MAEPVEKRLDRIETRLLLIEHIVSGLPEEGMEIGRISLMRYIKEELWGFRALIKSVISEIEDPQDKQIT